MKKSPMKALGVDRKNVMRIVKFDKGDVITMEGIGFVVHDTGYGWVQLKEA